MNRSGFTLIELAIVLVIIGLIIGGVLVGQNLIAAAEVRAQLSQIEKYQSAVNTFRSKFGYLPGDMPGPVATQFGLTAGTGCDGSGPSKRDGNGILDGWAGGQVTQRNETLLFWIDLSAAGLIDGSFPNGGAVFPQCNTGIVTALVSTTAGEYFPASRLGRGNFVYVYEINSVNWYGLSSIYSMGSNGILFSNPVISVAQTYSMDAKIDDGLPLSGNVRAQYLNGSGTGPGTTTASPNTTTSGGTTGSCYDTATGTYSVTMNNGNGGNCAFSFKFQ